MEQLDFGLKGRCAHLDKKKGPLVRINAITPLQPKSGVGGTRAGAQAVGRDSDVQDDSSLRLMQSVRRSGLTKKLE